MDDEFKSVTEIERRNRWVKIAQGFSWMMFPVVIISLGLFFLGMVITFGD